MSGRVWLWIGLGVLAYIVVLVAIWTLLVAARRSDEAAERMADEAAESARARRQS